MAYCLDCNAIIRSGSTRCVPCLAANRAARTNCRTPIACTSKSAKTCSACNLAALWKDPAFREKRRAAFAEKMRDPEFRAQHSAASSTRLQAWRQTDEGKAWGRKHGLATVQHLNTPEGLADRKQKVRATRLAGIPEHRWDEYLGLTRRMPAAEARRIILDDETAIERRRLAAMTPFERQLEQVRNGAPLVQKVGVRRADPAITLGGVSAGML